MAKCNCCGKDMLVAKGCVCAPIRCDGKEYAPIRCGDPYDFLAGAEPGTRCGDCGAMVGYYHHPGCDMEVCPICHGQLISCYCNIE